MSNQNQDKKLNLKQTFGLNETRSLIDKSDTAKTLQELKETDFYKNHESSDEALKTNDCSPKHIESLLSFVTKGLLVQSDDCFDLKAQVVKYTAPVDLQQPSLTDIQCEKEFLKISEMHKLDDKVQAFGLDISASANTHLQLSKFNASNYASGETNVETEKNGTEIYLAKAKYAFVPVKSFNFVKKICALMQQYKERFKSLENCLQNSEVKMKC
ncbi:unnamed protein product [Mytilus edulis]|uniref:Uncharacterized protein n=1 Tax=Mytilus edulis TaxID=6550 RepID=A0A8S3UWU8_MYTED|nr:unnamed protein product [Mytilus edulis]